MPMIDAAGCPIHVEVEGDVAHPPLMLSNSLGTNLHMWDAQMPDLLRHFRVIRYDSRGHGGSGAPKGPTSIARLGADALAVLDALDIERTNWLGLSKGGMVGQWLATHAPQRLRKVILANTSSHMPTCDMWNWRITTALRGGMKALAPSVLERWLTAEFRQNQPDEVEKVRQMLLTTPAHGYAACCAAIRDMDQSESIRSISLPVLVIVGDADPATPPAHGERIASAISGAQLVRLPAAHLSNIEQPAAFTAAAVKFLL